LNFRGESELGKGEAENEISGDARARRNGNTVRKRERVERDVDARVGKGTETFYKAKHRDGIYTHLRMLGEHCVCMYMFVVRQK